MDQQPEENKDVLAQRKQKIEDLKSRNIPLYPNDFRVSHDIREIRQAVEKAAPGEITEQGPVFQTAGRIVAVNRFGKSAFIRFRDRTGQIQAYIRKDKMSGETFEVFQKMEAGDFIGLTGPIFITRTGEWTLLATDLKLICKALRPLPEKFHGLKDPEKRYRQRYLDLIMNPAVRELFAKRSRVIQYVREFLIGKDFMEVETPMMHPVPGGAEAAPFKTYHNALGMELYLRIAPELYLKRLVVGGLERVFEINRNFRNEGVSTQHNPEFTMLEFYQAYATYKDLMILTEAMFRHVGESLCGTLSITYQGNVINLAAPWRRIPLLEALETFGGVESGMISDRSRLLALAEAKGVQVTKKGSIGKILTKLFDALVEPHLIQPTFITGYPVEVSPLSRRSETQPSLTDRFELFIGGREIANGFSELNDPEDQRNRFLEQVRERQAGDEEAHPMDEDYIEALEYGMPPTAGEGIGIDRMVMLFTDADSIREVIFFPHMKSKS